MSGNVMQVHKYGTIVLLVQIMFALLLLKPVVEAVLNGVKIKIYNVFKLKIMYNPGVI